MLTKTKKRANRWQALALAALVLAGGSIAVPQAADAATTRMDCNSSLLTRCTQRITVVKKKPGIPAPVLYINTSFSFFGHSFRVVDQSRGNKVVCSGNLSGTGEAKRCSVPNRTSVLTVHVYKQWWEGIGIRVRAF
ncbi:hypothetical protein [Microbacterium galbinum]|uniref:hypothetical protein n=1 Tax=Microbacterium galbinum TaxID=2851646 RepID=UPI001FFCC4E4|nr:hypothetical protein [Microbacterium galbinum]MCK2030386.1 hypothetical protein [Microbacterium galbinum]